MMKLHLGCGKRDFGSDWYHVDMSDYPHVGWHDVIRLMPIATDSVDLIYASHLLEYFDREEAPIVLKEWMRVLQPGGVLRVAVPDFDAMAALYITGKYDLSSFLGPLYGKMVAANCMIYHRTVYDKRSLKALLESVGFKDVRRYDWRKTEHAEFDDHSQAYLPHMDKEYGTLISLNVECIK